MSACTKNCYRGSKSQVTETGPKLPAFEAPDQRANCATSPLAMWEHPQRPFKSLLPAPKSERAPLAPMGGLEAGALGVVFRPTAFGRTMS